ncbi:MAG TPA: glycosyltransferase [Hymenobacter sp.]|jgi:glycosyltransferase involved in cell wall biosynthesis|uniref:glycosyltransferase n=1 Tax=Hymenobacter sp. TaxID=1898978 RepID=UPI002EDA9FB5
MKAPHSTGVSFLLCTYNGATRIAKTLACIAEQDIPKGLSWEVILVDNASTDGTAESARSIWRALGAPAPLQLLRESRPGKQYALETAIDYVQHSYTCIVDDDNRLAPDYMRTGVAILNAHGQIGVLGGQSTATFEGTEPDWFNAFQHCYAVGPQLDRVGGAFQPMADGNVGRNTLWGAGMFVRTEVWSKLREAGFKSLLVGRLLTHGDLTGGEDDELCFAAQLLGYEVWYSSKLQLHHHMSAGRLTETYRDKLVYASARSANRLNAYRNALWGKEDAAVGANLLKDIGYGAVGILKYVFSPAFLKTGFNTKTIEFMSQRNTLTQLQEKVLHFGRVRKYYEEVLEVKRKLRAFRQPV